MDDVEAFAGPEEYVRELARSLTHRQRQPSPDDDAGDGDHQFSLF
jgi:hypothetical protein